MKRPFLAAVIILTLLSALRGGAPSITSVEPKEIKSGLPGMLDIKGSGSCPGRWSKIGGRRSRRRCVRAKRSDRPCSRATCPRARRRWRWKIRTGPRPNWPRP